MGKNEYYKYFPWAWDHSHRHGRQFFATPPNNVFVYKVHRGGSWLKLLAVAIIGIYIGQNYEVPKIEGPGKMYSKFKEFVKKCEIKAKSIEAKPSAPSLPPPPPPSNETSEKKKIH